MSERRWDEICPATRGRGECTCATGRGLYTAVNDAIAAALAAERARVIEVARKMGTTYPVTLEPEPGSGGSTRHAAFSFADYLEDVPVERQGEQSS